MVDVYKLMIGNILQSEQGLVRITELSFENGFRWMPFPDFTEFRNDWATVNPVPVTAAFLERAGFESNEFGDFGLDSCFIRFRDDDILCYAGYRIDDPPSIQYFHEIQNIYLAMTGRQLPVNFLFS